MAGFAIIGCPTGTPPDDPLPSNFEDGNVDESAQSSLGKTSGEPNDDFVHPVVAVPEPSGLARLKGTVESTEDIDVYLLGALSAGDRVIVDALAVTSLDVSIALFDGDGRLVSENDDRSDQNLDSQVDFAARHDSDRYYLVITRASFAEPQRRTGAYTAEVEIQRGGSAPLPVPQTLFLRFNGATLDPPLLGRTQIAPFDASAIAATYSGKTEEIKQVIVDVVRQNYQRFDVSVISSDEFEPDPTDKFTTVFFGGFDDSAFGISENVDLYNADLCDDAIIFTESFSPLNFSSTPSAEEMGVAIGNVAAHEAGHLLGLNHVDDDLDLMDTTSPADAFLFDQEFMESPLSAQIVPIGTQDGVLLLNETVGPIDVQSARMIARGKQMIPNDPLTLGGVEIVKRQGRLKSTRPRL
jgi:hypothetical protein